MRMNRFYHSGELLVGSTVQLDKDVSGHVCRVLRLKAGDEIQLFNGDGNNYRSSITATGKRVTAAVLDSVAVDNESSLKLHLGQAISRGERMDFTLQKSVELGVDAITPLITERVQFRLDEKRMQRKMDHWQKVIESACEQSGRARLPQLHQPLELRSWLKADNSPGLLCAPGVETTLMNIEQAPAYRLLIGPEGGLSDSEIRLAEDSQLFKAIKLGPRILRTETAGLAAISILQARFGDL